MPKQVFEELSLLDCNFKNSWNVNVYEPYILCAVQIKCVTLFNPEQVQDKGKQNVDLKSQQRSKMTKQNENENWQRH